MSWPLGSHYGTMLQNPSLAFRDPDLKKCRIETYENSKQPIPRSGSFAVVYKATLEDSTEKAIRPFTSEVPERRERYDLIHRDLAAKRLSCMVDFDFSQKGIRSTDGNWYPLVTMEWVQGDTLFAWLHEACHRENRKALSGVVDKWVDLVDELQKAGISHGDLQHANVMVDKQGQLKLVDYDCMYVPSMGGKRRNLEIGVDPYQHPGRDGETLLSPELDNFSALFILVILKALAADPGLWKRYVCRSKQIEECEYEKLLIRRADFEDPAGSELYRELLKSTDHEVHRLARNLFEAFGQPIDDVRPLSVLLRSSEQFIEALANRDFDRVVELADQRGDLSGLSPDLVKQIEDARGRVKRREELERAVQAGNEQLMATLYDPCLLDDYPGADAAVAVAREAGHFIEIYSQLDRELKNQDWFQAETTWGQHRGRLQKRASSKKYSEKLEKIRDANQACQAVREALKEVEEGLPDTGKLEEAWIQVRSLGGHPGLSENQEQIERLISQGQHWKQLLALPEAPSQTNDRARYKFWKQHEQLFSDWPPAGTFQPKIEQVQKRLMCLQNLGKKIENSDRQVSLQSETVVVETAGGLPPLYTHNQSDRVNLAAGRIAAFKKLQRALERRGEAEIFEAWQELEAASGSTMVTSQSDRDLVEFSAECHPKLEQLQELKRIEDRLPLPEFESQLIGIFADSESLLEKCRDARPWSMKHETAIARRDILLDLGKAKDGQDDWRIVELADEPLLEDYPHPEEFREVIKTSRLAVDRAKRMLEALDRGDTKRFWSDFDSRTIRKFSDHFDRYADQVRQLVQSEIADPKRIGLQESFFSGQWHPGVNGTYMIRWKWPKLEFADRCVLALCPAEPKGSGQPEDHRPHFKIEVDQQNFQDAGGKQPIHPRPEWGISWLGVWAIVELGNGEKIYSEPLSLGPLKTTAG